MVGVDLPCEPCRSAESRVRMRDKGEARVRRGFRGRETGIGLKRVLGDRP